MRISVLIGTRNRAAPLLRCIGSVSNQSLRPHEILVLDDASDQLKVSELLAEGGVQGVQVLRSDSPLGVAAGRNRLYSQASGDVFFCLDDDAYFDNSECLAQVSQVLSQRSQTGIVATRIIDHRDAEPQVLAPFSKSSRAKIPELTEQSQLVSYFLGGSHAIRRETYETIGGYHESFVFGEEELELSYRAIQAGYEIFYAANIVVQHQAMASVLRSPSRPRSELFYHVRNRLFLAKRYLPAVYVAPYLSIWFGRYASSALRQGAVADFLAGIASGLRIIRGEARIPMAGEALSYLRRNHGRLWF